MDTNNTQPGTARQTRLLSENHRRVLATALRRVEFAAWQLEERLKQDTAPRLTLTHFTNTLDQQQRADLHALIEQVYEKIAQLTRDYSLEAREDDLARSVMAEFSLLWCDLEDSRPQKLRNYGEMHPHAQELLGPQIQELITLVLAIDRVAH